MVETLNSKDRIEVNLACRTLGVSKSGYYAWQKRPESARAEENKLLVTEISEVHARSRQTYGSPRITSALRDGGRIIGENRVARLMRENEIRSSMAKRFRVNTTDSNHDLPIAPRIFEAENAAKTLTAPNQVWCGDITYIDTQEGWLYLAVFLDVFSRKVVGFAADDHMRAELVLEALDMAIGRQVVI